MNEALDACGFRWCKGNVMASNPALCLSVEEWQAKMGGWLANWEPQALLDASIYFDFRALYGDASLATELRDWMLERTPAYPAFLRQMAQNAAAGAAGARYLRDFATEDAPNAPHSIDLKLYGVRLFVDAARIYALAQGLPQTNTVERLRAAGAGNGNERGGYPRPCVDAFLAIQRLRLRHQASQETLDEDTANRIDPDKLNKFERHDPEGIVPARAQAATAACTRLSGVRSHGPQAPAAWHALATRRSRCDRGRERVHGALPASGWLRR